MNIKSVAPNPDYTLSIVTEDGTAGLFNLEPYLKYEVFEPLKNLNEFYKVVNHNYYIEWKCGADLSADTILSKLIT